MAKINLENIKHKRILPIISRFTCAVFIGIHLMMLSFIAFLRSSDGTVSIEMSNINTSQIQDFGAYNVELFDYEKMSYYIKVNCKEQIVTVYTTDENGEFSIPIKNMICSTGKATPNSGVFKISDRYEWRNLVGNVYGQYATRITGPILFHSVPYTKKDKSTLEYWEYDKLGQPASKGCVRLTVEDSKWIYDYCKPGTKVEFCQDEIELSGIVSQTPKITEYDEKLRGWDPTDPDEDNPWLAHKDKNIK